MPWPIESENARLALDTILQKPVRGIPSWLIHPMEHAIIERLAGAGPGEYVKDPPRVYLQMQKNAGTALLDQYIPDNPLCMGDHGYQGDEDKSATQGATQIVRDGILIDSPEAVVEHMEKFVFPQIRQAMVDFNLERQVAAIIRQELEVQARIGPTMLKSGYGFIRFPGFDYYTYGYEAYFMAYALYPEVIEKYFSLAADLCLLYNQAAAQAYAQGDLPPIYRLDHDMADSRGTLVDVRSLDRIWFPHFARSLAPILKTNVRLIWHCDGNLMEMVPRLLAVGLHGFQGFQYEDGMDYQRICAMKTRQGEDLLIVAGVSVTRTLPHGSPQDVRDEVDFLVRHGPPTGLFLAGSSSIAPGVAYENIQALVQAFAHYRVHGRS